MRAVDLFASLLFVINCITIYLGDVEKGCGSDTVFVVELLLLDEQYHIYNMYYNYFFQLVFTYTTRITHTSPAKI